MAAARRRISFRALLPPSISRIFRALAAVTALVIVLVALGAGYMLGSLWWTVPVAAALLLLGLPPVLVVRHEVERVIRRRRARTFRAQGEGRGLAFGAGDRETTV